MRKQTKIERIYQGLRKAYRFPVSLNENEVITLVLDGKIITISTTPQGDIYLTGETDTCIIRREACRNEAGQMILIGDALYHYRKEGTF